MQVLGDVFVRGRQQKAGVRAVGQSADIEGDHPGECAIQRCCELVSDEPLRLLRQTESQPESVALPVREFSGRSQHQVSLTQSARGEQLHAFIDRQRQTVDEDAIAQFEIVDVQNGVEG